MTERPIQTFQRLIAENRELLEKLQSNQKDMEQLANYMLSVELDSSHPSVRGKHDGSQASQYGMLSSTKLPLDSTSSVRAPSQRDNPGSAIARVRPASVSGYREQSLSVISQNSDRGSQASVKRFPSGDSLHVNPPDTRRTETMRVIHTPRSYPPPQTEPSTKAASVNTRVSPADVQREEPYQRGPSALEARADLYAPAERWYLPRR